MTKNVIKETTKEIEKSDNNDFLKRRERFEKGLLALQEEAKLELYAANIVLPNQEVAPVIKIMDIKK